MDSERVKYKFESSIFIVLFLLFCVWISVMASFVGLDFSVKYANCDAPSGFCFNPYYNSSNWLCQERLSQGEYGYNPMNFLGWVMLSVVGYIGGAFLLNHIIYNRRKKVPVAVVTVDSPHSPEDTSKISGAEGVVLSPSVPVIPTRATPLVGIEAGVPTLPVSNNTIKEVKMDKETVREILVAMDKETVREILVAHCMKCKQKQPMKDIEEKTSEKGRQFRTGLCSICNKKCLVPIKKE
jgi:hypothetical protein